MRRDEIIERYKEIQFAAKITPQVVRIRKLEQTYPWYASGMIAVVVGGKIINDDTYLSLDFSQFKEFNLNIYYNIIPHIGPLRLGKDKYLVPIFYKGQHMIDFRYNIIPYREGMA